MGSDEESGKDWSDLEREAAEDDKERGQYAQDDYTKKSTKRGRGYDDRHSSSSNKHKHSGSSKHRYKYLKIIC